MNSPTIKGRYAPVFVGLEPDELARIDEIAQHQRSSRAAVLRQAVAFFLSRNSVLDATRHVDTVTLADNEGN